MRIHSHEISYTMWSKQNVKALRVSAICFVPVKEVNTLLFKNITIFPYEISYSFSVSTFMGFVVFENMILNFSTYNII